MFGLGMTEVLLILAIALIIIGPKKLPELAKTLGQALGEFKRSAQDFKRSIDVEAAIKDFEKTDETNPVSKKNMQNTSKKSPTDSDPQAAASEPKSPYPLDDENSANKETPESASQEASNPCATDEKPVNKS